MQIHIGHMMIKFLEVIRFLPLRQWVLSCLSVCSCYDVDQKYFEAIQPTCPLTEWGGHDFYTKHASNGGSDAYSKRVTLTYVF